MSIRLVITTSALPGRGDELAAGLKERCLTAMKEPGCEQFEVFRSMLDPDRMTVHERWTDEAAFDAHLAISTPALPQLRRHVEREDYVYNRTR